jgi:hypothetical protein
MAALEITTHIELFHLAGQRDQRLLVAGRLHMVILNEILRSAKAFSMEIVELHTS